MPKPDVSDTCLLAVKPVGRTASHLWCYIPGSQLLFKNLHSISVYFVSDIVFSSEVVTLTFSLSFIEKKMVTRDWLPCPRSRRFIFYHLRTPVLLLPQSKTQPSSPFTRLEVSATCYMVPFPTNPNIQSVTRLCLFLTSLNSQCHSLLASATA